MTAGLRPLAARMGPMAAGPPRHMIAVNTMDVGAVTTTQCIIVDALTTLRLDRTTIVDPATRGTTTAIAMAMGTTGPEDLGGAKGIRQ